MQTFGEVADVSDGAGFADLLYTYNLAVEAGPGELLGHMDDLVWWSMLAA
jgi:hypothetical protein